MERTRDWRRWKSEVIFINRVKSHNLRVYYHLHYDANGIAKRHIQWHDKIGMQNFYIYKSQTTLPYMRHHKCKWGKKGKRCFDYSSSPDTRPKQKSAFLKLLKSYDYL